MIYVLAHTITRAYFYLLVSGSIETKYGEDSKAQDPMNRLGAGLGNANASHGSFDKEFDPRTLTRTEVEMRKDMNISRTEKASKKDAKYKAEPLLAAKGANDKKLVPNKSAGVNIDLDNINPSEKTKCLIRGF